MVSLADTVEVIFGADTAALTAGLTTAATETKAATASMATSFEELKASALSVKTELIALGTFLAGGLLFGEAIKQTLDMTNQSRELANTMGINTQQAAGLKQALSEIGVSTDAYTQAFIKFDRQLKTHADQIGQVIGMTKQQILATTDSNSLFQKAVQTLSQYQAGQARNIVAMELFGRSITDVLDIQRLTNEAQAEAVQRAEELGTVITVNNVEAMKKWQKSSADAKEVLEAMWKSIGDSLLPVLTDLATWFASKGPEAVAFTKTAVLDIQAAFIEFGFWVMKVEAEVEGSLAKMASAAIKAAATIVGALTGTGNLISTLSSGVTDSLDNTSQATDSKIAALQTREDSAIKLLHDEEKARENSPAYKAPSGDKTTPDFSKPKRGGGAKKANREELQMAEELANEEKTLALQGLADKKAILDSEVRLGLITKEQELQQEQQFEDQKYEIEKTALDKKLAAMQNDPDSNPVAKQKILDELLTLQAKHESEILKLKLQTYEESQKYNTEATKSIEGDFTTLFSDVISGQKTLAQAFNDFVNSVSQAISKLAAQYLTAAIFGGGGGGGFGSFIGPLFGGGGGFSSLFGGGGGLSLSGGGLAGVAAFGGALATGGDVSPGMVYTVGENGAETFVPTVPGTIVPNGGSLAGSSAGVSVTNNFTINGSMSQANQQQIAYQVGQAVRIAMARNG